MWVLFSWMREPDSPHLLQPGRGFSIPTPQGDVSHHGPAVITIAPPAYVLFPFSDPFDDEDVFSTPPFPTLPATPEFALIGQPGSLPGPSVILDTLSRDLSLLIQPVSLSSLGPNRLLWALVHLTPFRNRTNCGRTPSPADAS